MAEKRTYGCNGQDGHLRGVREGKLEVPNHLARTVLELYFEPKYEEFRPRTIWSLSNAFTSGFKALEPIPQFKATTPQTQLTDPVLWRVKFLLDYKLLVI